MPKILAIDDKPDNLTTLSALLNNLMPGCAMVTARSGVEGIEKAGSELPDVILLDIKMPDMDGFETCRRLKSDESTKHIPVIMITAIKTDPQSRIKGLEIGADAFLAKPIDQYELTSQVKVALRIKKAEDALREERDTLDRLVEERTAALVESEVKFRGIYEQSPIAIEIYDKDGKLIDVNQQTLNMFGVNDKKHVLGFDLWADPNLRDEKMKLLKSGQEIFLSTEFDFGIVRENNLYPTSRSGKIYMDMYALPLLNEKEITGFLVQIIETTERKQVEQNLIQNQYYLQKAQEIGTIGSWEFDLIKDELIWTDETYRIFGLKLGKPVTYDTFINIVHPKDRELVGNRWKDTIEGEPYDIEHRLLVNGEAKWVHQKAEIFYDEKGKAVRALGFTQNITETKTAQIKRENFKNKLLEAQETAGIGSWDYDFEEKCSYWTPEMYKIFGLDENYGPIPWPDHKPLIHPDDWERIDQVVNTAFTKGTSYSEQFRIVHKNGSIVWAETRGNGQIDEKGNVISLSGTVQNITERKQAEREALILHAAIDQAPIGIALADQDVNIFYCNPEGLGMRGGNADDLVGISIDAFKNWQVFMLNGEPYETENLPLVRAIKKGEIIREEFIVRHQDGSDHICDAFACPVFENRKIVAGMVIFLDITKRKRMEEELHQAQKMESIGTLAGGIAHDFNNILSSIIGFTELALDEIPKGTILEENIQEVYSAGQRAKDLVNQILVFARKADEKVRPIQPSKTVKEVMQFIRSTIPTTIEIQQEIESESLIMGNDTQVHQVLMNLCTNAAHAMEDQGGILRVSLKDVVLDKGLEVGMRPGDYVEIKVSDTGVGIASETIGQIFEPYFTTKGGGDGTGLGLAMVHGIVESFGGKITVKSQVGKGTTFTIHLPISKKRLDHAAYVPEKLPTGTERILFVDDEASIAKMGARNLEGLGYSVSTRTNSLEALELFKSKPNEFDLVITDITMPNMTGDKLSIELMKIRPDIPIIICTGYSKKVSVESAYKIGIKAFAYKPAVKADLAKTVRKVLDEA